MSTEPTNDPFSSAPGEPSSPFGPGNPPTPAISLPTRPDYEVLEFIGKGGYGEVYLARDKEGRFWAVKVVYRISFDHERPYEREYEGISKFEPISRLSESQLQILHVGRRDEAGYFYYIMELADDLSRGRDIQPAGYFPHTLKSELQQHRRIAPTECCHLMRSLTVALGNLHRHGLVHRDIKPANIIFVKGRPKLADPGLITDADKSMTCAGTDGYIPPEGPGSVRADIYSLGMVLYEALTGNSRWDFPKLPQDFEEWPDHKTALELNRIIAKACHINVRKRYQSTREMEKDLDRIILKSGHDGGARVVKPARKALVNAVILCLALGATPFILFFGRGRLVGRSADSSVNSGTTSSVATPAPTDVLGRLDGQWQGHEQAGAEHWQALSFFQSPERKLQAEMKDLTKGYLRACQSVVLDGNHLTIILDDDGGPVLYEGDIDYAWERISGNFTIHGIIIPLQFDFVGVVANDSTSGKSSSPAICSGLIGRWQTQFDDQSVAMFTFGKSPDGNLKAEWRNITRRNSMFAQYILRDNNRIKIVLLNGNDRLCMFEGDIDGDSRAMSGTWTGPVLQTFLRFGYVEP